MSGFTISFKKAGILLASCALLESGFASHAFAAPLPGAADAGRVDLDHKEVTVPEMTSPVTPGITMPGSTIPPGAEEVKFVLKDIQVEGSTVFTPDEIKAIYAGYINNEVSLDLVWKIADKITKKYQDAGYFLSYAFVPEQDIENGIFKIKVVEGYVGEVQIDDLIAENRIVKSLVAQIKEEKPASSQKIESILLRLNDIPGVTFRSVFEPLEDERKEEGAVKLIIIKEDKKGEGTVSFDNFNSRYLGPYEGTLSYETSIIPMQRTTVSTLASAPLDKLKYFNGSHEIPLTSSLFMQIYANYTEANPGYTLSSKDVTSNVGNLGISLKEQIIRQRQENLSVTLILDGKNNYSDTLNAPLTRDRIRAFRAILAYDVSDPMAGYNFLNFTLSQGLSIFDSSSEDDLFLSRARSNPNFHKLEYSYSRFQNLGTDWTAVTALNGQVSDSVLFSSEQFGYGGQAFGRAYDPSEIIGDNGIAGSLELRYLSLPAYRSVSFTPYGFYDLGKVWNNTGGSEAGSSAGFGIRMESVYGIYGSFTIAQPLTRRLEDPLDGNGKNPRYLLQLSYKF